MLPFNAYNIIMKKRQGEELTREELHYLISGYVSGEIPDYQMSAWAMAVYFQGMTFREASDFTLEMAHSGELIDLSKISKYKFDKHSTGGVGDKTTLVISPILAAAGITVAKMSGRGLGHTGGTIDKLESIPGFSTSLTREQFLKQAQEIGVVLSGQTADLVPADKKLYALRDQTATVESLPLIAASIVSKKLASGADYVLLDVKFGDGAMMKDYDKALELARTMVEIGNSAGRHFRAILTGMEQPLGFAIGNALEVIEAIETLKGRGPADLTEVCVRLVAESFVMLGLFSDIDSAKQRVEQLIADGSALDKFRQFVTAQGGDVRVIDDYSLFPQAKQVVEVRADAAGYVASISSRNIGMIAMEMGAGRSAIGGKILPEVGIVLQAKVGDKLQKGSLLAKLYFSNTENNKDIAEQVKNCFKIQTQQPPMLQLIHDII